MEDNKTQYMREELEGRIKEMQAQVDETTRVVALVVLEAAAPYSLGLLDRPRRNRNTASDRTGRPE